MGMEASAGQFSWQKRAACNGVPSYIFFPDERKLPGFREVPGYEGVTFQDYCGGCRVRNVCEEFAVLHSAIGVWGGMLEPERNRKYSKNTRKELRSLKTGYFPLWGESETPDVDVFE